MKFLYAIQNNPKWDAMLDATFCNIKSAAILEPPHGLTNNLHMPKQKTQISFAVTAKLISAFVFAKRIVQSPVYLYPKFQASRSFLCLYRSVCVGPIQNHIVGFPMRRLTFRICPIKLTGHHSLMFPFSVKSINCNFPK